MHLDFTTATIPSAPGPTAAAPTTDDVFDDDVPRERVLVVDAAGCRLAIPVARVREVQRASRATRVPGAPPVMHGLANVRGAVVTVLDLSVALEAPFARTEEWPAQRLHAGGVTAMPSSRGETTGSIVLLEHGTQLVGLRVDAVREVPARDDAPLAPAAIASRLDAAASTHAPLAGVVRAEGQDIALLDITALFSRYLLSSKE